MNDQVRSEALEAVAEAIAYLDLCNDRVPFSLYRAHRILFNNLTEAEIIAKIRIENYRDAED